MTDDLELDDELDDDEGPPIAEPPANDDDVEADGAPTIVPEDSPLNDEVPLSVAPDEV